MSISTQRGPALREVARRESAGCRVAMVLLLAAIALLAGGASATAFGLDGWPFAVAAAVSLALCAIVLWRTAGRAARVPEVIADELVPASLRLAVKAARRRMAMGGGPGQVVIAEHSGRGRREVVTVDVHERRAVIAHRSAREGSGAEVATQPTSWDDEDFERLGALIASLEARPRETPSAQVHGPWCTVLLVDSRRRTVLVRQGSFSQPAPAAAPSAWEALLSELLSRSSPRAAA